MSINFLQRDDRDKKRANAIRAIVLPITTAVMVVYMILVSALLGWWWWWSNKQERVSAEYVALKGQVDSKQQSEILVRRMTDRVKVVNTYLNSRKDIYAQTGFLVDQPYTVKRLGLDKSGYYFSEIAASESAMVTDVEDVLKREFEDVTLKRMGWDKNSNLWRAEYWFRGGKTNG